MRKSCTKDTSNGGVALMVETLTDNRNRTASDVRHLFDKFGNGLGTTGCVSYMFSHQGVIAIEKKRIWMRMK